MRPVVCVIARVKEQVTSLPSTFNAIDEEMQAKHELSALMLT